VGNYVVRETEEPAGVDQVRYRGACDGGGQLEITEDADLTCVVTNVNLVNLTIDKVCVPEDLEGGPFEINVYRESVSPGNLEAPLLLGCGENNAAEPLEIDDTIEYVITETPPGGETEVTYSGSCLQDGNEAFVTPDAEDVTCTVTNTGALLQKYTSLEDEVLQPFELFSWYIDVPAQDGAWVLFDVLPFGMWVLSVDAPAGVVCAQFGFGIVCTGNTSETVTIEIHVIASAVCGQYTNVAKLTSTFQDVQFIPDSVQVCGPEQEEELPEEEIVSTGLFSTGQSWWSRLWLGLFSR
jgi:hypothetical protein